MPTMPTLTLDEATHTYYADADGQKVPWSVTQVIEAAGLVDFSGSAEEAKFRGGRVHRAIHYDLEGDLDESSVAPQEMGYIYAARKFLDHTRFRPRLIEHRVWSKIFGVAGTLDLEGSMADNPAVIVDWKAGGVQKGYAVQLAAYLYLKREWDERSAPPPAAYRRYTVQLVPDGTFRVKEWPAAQLTEDWVAFQAALTLANFRKLRGIPNFKSQISTGGNHGSADAAPATA